MPSRRFVIRAGALAAASAGPLLPAQAQSRAARIGDMHPDMSLRVGGRVRRYRLVAPLQARAGAPLMIALHGMGIDSTSLMPVYSGLDDLARANGAVLVYPASLENHWPLSFGTKLSTELGFLDALVAHVQQTHATDPRQVYLLGMSNGGYFAVVVASRRSQHIAGLAVHSGSAGVLGGGFATQRKFPVYIAHGNADPIINVRDGRWLGAMFERMGHPTRFEEIEGLGHAWAREQGVNARIWAHWRAHRA